MIIGINGGLYPNREGGYQTIEWTHHPDDDSQGNSRGIIAPPWMEESSYRVLVIEQG